MSLLSAVIVQQQLSVRVENACVLYLQSLIVSMAVLSCSEKSVKKLAALPVPQPLAKITAAAPEPAKPGDNREARRKERQTRTPPRR